MLSDLAVLLFFIGSASFSISYTGNNNDVNRIQIFFLFSTNNAI